MYGVILIANTEKFLKAPPEMTSKNPNRVLLATRSAKIFESTPGTGICAPNLNTKSMARVKSSFLLSSSIFQAAFRVLIN